LLARSQRKDLLEFYFGMEETRLATSISRLEIRTFLSST